jgi:hypothetical protein
MQPFILLALTGRIKEAEAGHSSLAERLVESAREGVALLRILYPYNDDARNFLMVVKNHWACWG